MCNNHEIVVNNNVISCYGCGLEIILSESFEDFMDYCMDCIRLHNAKCNKIFRCFVEHGQFLMMDCRSCGHYDIISDGARQI